MLRKNFMYHLSAVGMPLINIGATIANRLNNTVDPAGLEAALRRRDLPNASSADFWQVMNGGSAAEGSTRPSSRTSKKAISSEPIAGPSSAKQSRVSDEELLDEEGDHSGSENSGDHSAPTGGSD